MKPLALFFCSIPLLGVCAPIHAAPAATPSTEVQARIDRVEHGLSTRIVVKGAPGQKRALAERMAFHQVPAVSIALINDGQVEWARAYGVAEAGGTRPVTPDTVFQAGSVSKAVTAIGTLRLVEQGRLQLDVPVNQQLTSWRLPDNAFTRQTPVSLRMLLNHSGGTAVHGYDGHAQGAPLPTALQVLDGTPPANAEAVRVDVLPGTLWRYSGGGYSVIQQLVTEASAQPFGHYMTQAVLAPLQMSHSSFAVPLAAELAVDAASGHDGQAQVVSGRWRNYSESAAAGLWSTPRDLAQVVLAVQAAAAGKPGALLAPATATTMLKRGLGEYGLGWFVEDLADRTSFSHSGGTEGYRTQVYGYTGSGQGVVVMTNSVSGAALIDEILTSVAAEYGWPEFAVVEKTPVAVDVASNQQAAGEYRVLDQPAHIAAEGDRLFFQSGLFGAKPMELFPESADTYFMTAQDMRVRIERDASGQVQGITLLRGAGSYSGPRVR